MEKGAYYEDFVSLRDSVTMSSEDSYDKVNEWFHVHPSNICAGYAIAFASKKIGDLCDSIQSIIDSSISDDEKHGLITNILKYNKKDSEKSSYRVEAMFRSAGIKYEKDITSTEKWESAREKDQHFD